MTTYDAGQQVRYGLYLSTKPLDMHFVGADDEALPQEPGGQYRRVPTPLVVAAGPVIGGVFVMAFPVIIFAAIATALYRLAARSVRSLAARNAHLARVNWEPSAAYLHKGADGAGEKDGGSADDLAELEEEVAKRREEEDAE